ncbi:Similar to ASTRA-associated protein 1; acc. no. C9STX5 [Pyronema omphalodes CBS 100304]|uniref:ASTRA-associated protein 1 n=1 Tax=Pyronema omphalodes (strain CBS 100304) TaxID=1076935 RepID=U4LNF9_PYROM|nr:Similar to ASTRA-associated protein 1; acc. no. C9STX5 [Pyronema omphalodes CBS 100304]
MSATPAPPAPPQPAYILRGHQSPINTLTFLCRNTLLATADASGICVLWRLSTRRPIAVWAAHNTSILAVSEWRSKDRSDSRLITHGRDNKLRVWKIPREEDGVATMLPAEGEVNGKAPWLVVSMEVNTLNFCGFGMCQLPTTDAEGDYNDILIAVPSVLNSQAVDIFQLPSTQRVHTRINATATTGMAMALQLSSINDALTLVAGYESGHVVVFRLRDGNWEETYSAQSHSQPVLSLALAPDATYFLTTSADSLVVRHPTAEGEVRKVDTRHAGLQSVAIRSDGKLFATAGWDGKFRVFSTKGRMKELAVLKWHTEGCYAVGFAEVLGEGEQQGEMAVETVEEARVKRETGRHWIAGGAKDGRVSLWDLF